MHRKFRILVTSLVVVCVWAAAAYAQEPKGFPNQPKYYGSVPYLSGGVGLDEREALNQMGKDYNLKLSFAVTSGDYLGDVAVEIRDSAGRVALQAVSEGPWFFSKLPPGRYTVVVKGNEKTQKKAVQVSGKGQTVLNIFWQ
jgi:hypothetical protein